MLNNELIAKLEGLAVANGYEVEMDRTPAFDIYEAVKGDVKIHIASVSHTDYKINTLKSFKNEIEENEENDYTVNLINSRRCNFDNGKFTSLKAAKEWAEGHGGNYTAYFIENYDPETNVAENEFQINY